MIPRGACCTCAVQQHLCAKILDLGPAEERRMRRDSKNHRRLVIKRATLLSAICALAMSLTSAASPEKSGASDAKKPAASSKDAKPAAGAAAHKPIVYEFGASYCVPCRVFAPTFQKLKARYAGKAEF